jgi:hypothetical protein
MLRRAPAVSLGRHVRLGPNSGEDRQNARQQAMARAPTGPSRDLSRGQVAKEVDAKVTYARRR